MTIIKCACNQPDCKTSIAFDFDKSNAMMIITSKDGKTSLMYLDANTIHQLVKELRATLFEMVFEDKS